MAPLTLETFTHLPERCRRCALWELGEQQGGALAGGDAAFEKEAWLSRLLLRWSAAGRVAYVDGSPAGFVAVAPPALASRSADLPTAPVGSDAALMLVARVGDRYRGTGVARMLVQGVAKDLTQQGYRAIEVFGSRGGAEVLDRGAAAGSGQDAPAGAPACMVPAAFAEAVGFVVAAEHHAVPRLRLELRTALDWREDVEAALDHLMGSLSLASG